MPKLLFGRDRDPVAAGKRSGEVRREKARLRNRDERKAILEDYAAMEEDTRDAHVFGVLAAAAAGETVGELQVRAAQAYLRAKRDMDETGSTPQDRHNAKRKLRNEGVSDGQA